MRALAILLAGLLTACAGGPMVVAPGAVAGKAALEAPAEMLNGLALSRWAPRGAPGAVILALHGFGDYGPSTYAAAAAFWAERGFLTYAYDQRGFGRNASRGRWPGADALIADAVAAAQALKARHPDLPLILIGHSMGGGVALSAAGAGAPIDRLILAAPAVWGGEHLDLHYRVAAWGGALFFPDRRWSGDGIVQIQASDNIGMLRALGRDPVYLRNPSSREFMGLIRLMDRAVEAAPGVAAPTLTLIGAKDEVVDAEPIRAAHDTLSARKRLIEYEDGWHLLFRDLQAAKVWADIAEWIKGEA